MTCAVFDICFIFCAIRTEALPLTPVSISSNISVSFCAEDDSIFLNANIMRLNSPPEATAESGLTFSPTFVLIKNSTSSAPSKEYFFLSVLTCIRTFGISSSESSFVTSLLISSAAFFLESVNTFAFATSSSCAFASSASSFNIASSEYSICASFAFASARYEFISPIVLPYFLLSEFITPRRSSISSSSLGLKSNLSASVLTSSASESISAKTFSEREAKSSSSSENSEIDSRFVTACENISETLYSPSERIVLAAERLSIIFSAPKRTFFLSARSSSSPSTGSAASISFI